MMKWLAQADPSPTLVTFKPVVAAAAGPVMINVLGYDVPVLAALLSIAGVVLASIIAPPPPLRPAQKWALTILLCILVLGLVIADPGRSLLVSTCWAIGIGYSGLPLIQAIQARIFPQAVDAAGPVPPAGEDVPPHV